MQEEISPIGNIFAQTLIRHMSARGLNNRQLAIQCGISPTAVGRYLDGRVPRAEELLKLSEALGCSVDALLGKQAHTNAGETFEDVGIWRDRAIAAEAKVQMLKSGLSGLLKKI